MRVNPPDPLHAAADRLHPRLRAAFVLSVKRARAAVDTAALTRALVAKDVKRAVAAVGTVELEPMAELVKQAVVRGGEVGAERLNMRRKA